MVNMQFHIELVWSLFYPTLQPEVTDAGFNKVGIDYLWPQLSYNHDGVSHSSVLNFWTLATDDIDTYNVTDDIVQCRYCYQQLSSFIAMTTH